MAHAAIEESRRDLKGMTIRESSPVAAGFTKGLVVLGLLSLCCASKHEEDGQHSQASRAGEGLLRPADTPLLVVAGARSIEWTERDGVDEVRYEIDEVFPPSKTLRALHLGLEASGWRLAKEDPLNPGRPIGEAGGWMRIMDATSARRTEARLWNGAWRYSDGGIIWYQLRYHRPVGGTTPWGALQVDGVYWPAEVARLVIAHVGGPE